MDQFKKLDEGKKYRIYRRNPLLNYIVKNYKWGPSWWRKDRMGNKKCLQGLKLKSLLMKEESEKLA